VRADPLAADVALNPELARGVVELFADVLADALELATACLGDSGVAGQAPVRAWPDVRIILRGDSGFCRRHMLSWCERNAVYELGLIGTHHRLQINRLFNRQ
jgi:hypothetical protein